MRNMGLILPLSANGGFTACKVCVSASARHQWSHRCQALAAIPNPSTDSHTSTRLIELALMY